MNGDIIRKWLKKLLVLRGWTDLFLPESFVQTQVTNKCSRFSPWIITVSVRESEQTWRSGCGAGWKWMNLHPSDASLLRASFAGGDVVQALSFKLKGALFSSVHGKIMCWKNRRRSSSQSGWFTVYSLNWWNVREWKLGQYLLNGGCDGAETSQSLSL